MGVNAVSQKPRKVLELVDNDGDIFRLYVQQSPNRSKFMLFVSGPPGMSDADIASVLGAYMKAGGPSAVKDKH